MTIPKGQKPICKMLEVIAQHVDSLRFEEKPDYELIIRTARGRRLTDRGEAHLGDAPRSGPQQKLF